MKRILISSILALFAAMTANAQYFDFSLNNGRIETGFNAGQVGTTTQYARFGSGAHILAWGAYLDFTVATPQHRYDSHVSDTQWNDNKVIVINTGYQIPVVKWFRLMPLVGYVQTNEGLTDASTINISTGEESGTFYHDYTVTPGTRKHYFNFGGGISVQPIKWFSISMMYTRYAIYGGISLNLTAFAAR